LIVASDITERREAEKTLHEQHDFLQRIIDSVPDLILVKDQKGRFKLANDSTAKIYNMGTAELVGKIDADVNPNQDEVDFFRQMDEQALKGNEPLFIPEQLIMGRYYQTNKIPLRNAKGKFDQLLVVSSDITDRKEAEQLLQLALEKEQELSELKTRFVSMASHEFRTPLATILALTETILAYRDRLTNEQVDERLGKIQLQVEHLKNVMEDVLQLARFQARRVHFNPALMDLDALCRSVLDEFQSRPDIKHELNYSCDLALRHVILDKRLMRQIINNLVSNAIKYSPSDQPITIKLEHRHTIFVMTVQDNGIGIPDEDLKHLFEPFHRAANVGTISGTGLGLVITKEAVELHGGEITVESVVGTGTTFRISMPISNNEELTI
jgi:PAS domain S-box-containing protein